MHGVTEHKFRAVAGILEVLRTQFAHNAQGRAFTELWGLARQDREVQSRGPQSQLDDVVSPAVGVAKAHLDILQRPSGIRPLSMMSCGNFSCSSECPGSVSRSLLPGRISLYKILNGGSEKSAFPPTRLTMATRKLTAYGLS